MKNASIQSGDHKSSKEHLNGHDIDEQIDGEGLEAMPAPLFRESFFSAIDESLKLIESSKWYINIDFLKQLKDINFLFLIIHLEKTLDANDNESCMQQQQQKPKKKKKTRLLLFSTA